MIEVPNADIYEEVFFENEMGGWVYSPHQATLEENLLIYFNGNAGNISTRITNIRILKKLLPTFTIYNFDYPGFGLSSHLEMNFENIVTECTVAVQSILRMHSHIDQCLLWGESLGALIQAHVFPKVKTSVTGIIHMNGVVSLTETLCPYIPKLSQAFLLPLVPAQNPKVSNIYRENIDPTRQTLFLFHAGQDDIVSDLQSKRLFLELYPILKKSIVFSTLRGKHNMTLVCKENQEILTGIFREHGLSRPVSS